MDEERLAERVAGIEATMRQVLERLNHLETRLEEGQRELREGQRELNRAQWRIVWLVVAMWVTVIATVLLKG